VRAGLVDARYSCSRLPGTSGGVYDSCVAVGHVQATMAGDAQGDKYCANRVTARVFLIAGSSQC
jgi:hypothetical protein